MEGPVGGVIPPLLDSPAYQPPDAAPPSAPAAPMPAPPSLTDLYMKARTQGLNDTDAALAVAQHLRQQADVRSTFREAGAVAAGRPYDAVGERAQLMSEADRPMQDLAARRGAEDRAFDVAGRAAGLAQSDIGMQQAALLRDPNHPTNVAMRQAFSRMGLTPPAGLTVAALPKEMWETVKPLAELTGKGMDINAQAPLRASEAAKNVAEAGRTGAMTGPDVAKTSAEAAKAAAEAGVEAQKIGGQVAPGWVRNGSVANVGDKEIEEFRTQATAAQDSARYANELIGLLQGKDYILDPTKRAKAAVATGKLLGSLKNGMGIRGLPAQDVNFLETMAGDLSAGRISNLVGYTKNPVRLQALAEAAKAEVASRAQTLGLAPTSASGGSAPAAGDQNARAVKWAQEHPKDPRAAKILEVASRAAGGASAGGSVAGR